MFRKKSGNEATNICKKKRTDIAPHWRPVNGVPAPNDRVDKVNETAQGGPDHVHARPHIPRLQMPPERDEGEDEADPGEDGERGIGGGHVLTL